MEGTSPWGAISGANYRAILVGHVFVTTSRPVQPHSPNRHTPSAHSEGHAKVILRIADFNGSGELAAGNHAKQWTELQKALKRMPLHIKASDQAGLQGNPIFDPVGTNAYIKDKLEAIGWASGIPIPTEYRFLGTDVDYGRNGVLVEVQFSNYPFLLNNTLRSELFFKSKTCLPQIGRTRLVVIVTKAHMFPSSNSTLYYEQAENQLSALARNKVFDCPIRLVGLFGRKNAQVRVTFTEYHNPRYSRTVVKRETKQLRIASGRSARSRCNLEIIPD